MKKLIQELEGLFDKIQEGNYLIGQENREEFYRLTGLLKQQPSEIDQLIDNFKKGKEYAKNIGERESVLYTYDFIIGMIKNHRP